MDLRVADNPDEDRYEVFADGELAGFARLPPAPGADLVRAHRDRRRASRARASARRWSPRRSTTPARAGSRVLPFCPFVNALHRAPPRVRGPRAGVRARALRALGPRRRGGAPRPGGGVVSPRDRHRPPAPLPPAPHRGGRFPAGAGGGHPPLPPARARSAGARAGGRGPADPALSQRPHLRHALRDRRRLPRPRAAPAIASAARSPRNRVVHAGAAAVLELPARRCGVMTCRAIPPGADGGRLRGRRRRPSTCSATTSLAERFEPFAAAERRRRAAPVSLQAARAAAARPQPARRLGARRAARDPGQRGRDRSPTTPSSR